MCVCTYTLKVFKFVLLMWSAGCLVHSTGDLNTDVPQTIWINTLHVILLFTFGDLLNENYFSIYYNNNLTNKWHEIQALHVVCVTGWTHFKIELHPEIAFKLANIFQFFMQSGISYTNVKMYTYISHLNKTLTLHFSSLSKLVVRRMK